VKLICAWLFFCCVLTACETVGVAASEAFWKAGVAKSDITPGKALWMAGYAGRTKPAEGEEMPLWIKVLALEDADGKRAIILTSDTLGIPRSIHSNVCVQLKQRFNLEPAQILLTASHTHCGPVLRSSLYDAYPLDTNQLALIEEYSSKLERDIVETVERALSDLAPARVAAGQGSAGFSVNRRNNPEKNVPASIAEGDLKGPSDHSVPVLAVSTPEGKLKAVLFGYACHNTTMDYYKWSGDYAGFAQMALEKSHPEATAMFFMGCGGDQNPLPRHTVVLAQRYGNMLAAAVEETLLQPPATLEPALKTSMEIVPLDFGPELTTEALEKVAADPAPSHQRWAKRLLAQLKAGERFPRSYPYPIQVWHLGSHQLLITLGGEPVVDYAFKFKNEFGNSTWVAGYSNDVMTYIPSLRVLKEGGYEGGLAMIPYGQPTLRWDDDVEDLIAAAVGKLVKNMH
jgi:neutral ceramidase